MASILALAGAALINAVAFSGTNFLFSALSDHGAAERKRHDLAVEDLTKARDEWIKKRQQKIDFLNEKLREQNEAAKYLSNLDEAMQEYYLITKQHLPQLPPKPQLSDFYHPSDQQKQGEILVISTGLGLIGFLIYKYK